MLKQITGGEGGRNILWGTLMAKIAPFVSFCKSVMQIELYSIKSRPQPGGWWEFK